MVAREHGYTLVEVMMALTVLAIGAAGIFALQTVAVRGNADSADLTAATNIARDWTERIKADALDWNTSALPGSMGDANDTFYLNGITPSDDWHPLLPQTATGLAVATPQRADGTFDANGQFCAHMRLRSPTAAVAGLPAIEGLELTVRVWWFKGPYQNRGAYPQCGTAQVATMGADLTHFHWVYVTTFIAPTGLVTQ